MTVSTILRATMRSRWSKSQICDINKQLKRGRLKSLPFPPIVVDGQSVADLRGIAITTAFVRGKYDRVDFSYCIAGAAEGLGGVLQQCEFIGCRFVGSQLWTNLGDKLIRCDLTEANLKGAWLRGRFEECSFRAANLVSVDGGTEKFIRCDFTDAKMRKATLYDCVFDYCIWKGASFGSGSLAGSTFLGTRPTEAQLGDTIMDNDE